MKQELSLLDKLKLKHIDRMHYYGLKHNRIFPYPDQLFDLLRPYNMGGFPASILLFENELCNGHCYDRAMLMQLPFEDARVVHADIETLRVSAGEDYAEHAFVETEAFGCGKTWVIDTSMGLIFDKDFYYRIERPKINRVFSKEECMRHPDIIENLAGDFEKDKYSLLLTLPLVESAIKASNHLGTVIYRERILKEIEKFKQDIKFDEMEAEVQADMQLLKSEKGASKKIDARLGIVRDEYGREISRNGVPNPYYKSREQIEAENAEYEAIKGDPEKEKEYFERLVADCVSDMEREFEANSTLAESRLKQIFANPNANYYELFGDSKDKTQSQMGE